jgi:D-serine deaminase-like pyridoxal phosphate-dependent protein
MDQYRPPVGTLIGELDTPCLLIDMDALEHNFRRIAVTFENTDVKIREHTKNVKSPLLAHMQMRAGGSMGGVCTAKVAEAEVMVEGGIPDVLIANQIVTSDKIARVAALAKRAIVTIGIDNEQNLRDISRIASEQGSTVGVSIEVDTNMGRAGVRSLEAGVHLARVASGMPGIKFMGVMSHSSVRAAPKDEEERVSKAIVFYRQTLDLAEAIRAEGIEVAMVSAGETYSYDTAAQVPGITDVEGGSYALMSTSMPYMESHFQYAAKVLGTVVSRPRPGVAIGDIGYRAIGSSLGKHDPEVEGVPNVKFVSMHDELCVLKSEGEMPLKVGDQFQMRSSQQDLTVNRYDNFIAVRNGVVEEVISIPGRGCHN